MWYSLIRDTFLAILQRTTVDVGQIKIQGVATCLYLCMDQCGAVYGSKDFTDDCVFNESMEQHHFNTYSSTFNSNSRRTLYLALNRHGDPRKLQIPPTRPLGKLATYTKALPEPVSQERVEKLIARTFGENRIKHGLRQLCDAGKPLIELTTKVMKDRPKCIINANGPVLNEKPKISNISNNNNNSNSSHNSNSPSNNGNNVKKKKKKRRCRPDEPESEICQKPGPQALKKRPQRPKCSTEEECANRRKKKQNQPKQNGGNGGGGGNGRKNRRLNGGQQQQQLHQQQQHQPQQQQNNKKGRNGNGGGGRTTTVRTRSRTLSTTTNRALYGTTEQNTSNNNNSYDDDNNDDIVSSSTESHDEDDDHEETSSIPLMGGGHTQLVGGDYLFYDDEFDV